MKDKLMRKGVDSIKKEMKRMRNSIHHMETGQIPIQILKKVFVLGTVKNKGKILQ